MVTIEKLLISTHSSFKNLPSEVVGIIIKPGDRQKSGNIIHSEKDRAICSHMKCFMTTNYKNIPSEGGSGRIVKHACGQN